MRHDRSEKSNGKPEISIFDNLEQLLHYKNQSQALSKTEPCITETGDWQITDLDLVNAQSDYFSISLYKTDPHGTCFLITQNQPALVMLVMAEVDGETYALLNLRYEPGLIENINYTATIQSTPNNYLRQHGGKETPFLELAVSPQQHGAVLLDTENYDWGDLYVLKKKRYLILKINNLLVPPIGFFWVTQDVLVQMARHDQLITNDLRVCVPFLHIKAPMNMAAHSPCRAPSRTIAKVPFDYKTVDSDGRYIRFFRAQTRAREVGGWIQPLLVGCKPKHIRLTFKEVGRSKCYALIQSSQVGLLGERVWYPAEIANAEVCQSVFTSAEGGRFWRHAIHIQLLKLTDGTHNSTDEDAQVLWFTKSQLLDLIATPLATSLELRMALSMVDFSAEDE